MLDKQRIEEALILATMAHKDQTDKLGIPYIYHPMAVAWQIQTEYPSDIDLFIAAILHDVVEDNKRFSVQFIRDRFGDRVANIVDSVTKRPGESYELFIYRCIENEDAIKVKKADIAHNLSRMSAIMDMEKRAKMVAKYHLAIRIIEWSEDWKTE